MNTIEARVSIVLPTRLLRQKAQISTHRVRGRGAAGGKRIGDEHTKGHPQPIGVDMGREVDTDEAPVREIAFSVAGQCLEVTVGAG